MGKSISVSRIDEIDEHVVKIDKSWVLMRQAVYNKLMRTLTLFTNAKERELIDGKFYAIRERVVLSDIRYDQAVNMYDEVKNVLIPDLAPLDISPHEKHRQLMLRLADIVDKANG